MACSVLSRSFSDCSDEVVCACLQVTAGDVLEALGTCAIRTLKDLKRETGAGDGCMVCHRLLRKYLDEHVPQSALSSPICSER
jgi:NAD(P)H-nitrite reductase large subunit